jgi:hypothetical protein
MTTTKTLAYKGYTGIARISRPGIVQVEIPALRRTVQTHGDLEDGMTIFRLTIDHDCLTAEEVEERDKDVD